VLPLMADRFRIAIVGCGKISNAHAQAVLATPTAELTALVDSSLERAHALAARVGAAPTITADLNAVLPSIDGAIIATPNHTHAALAIRCLEHRIATLIEKPLAISVAESERICQAAESSGACLAVGYVTRFRDNVRLMARLLKSGRFGTVRRFAYQFGSRGGWAPVSGYNLDRAATGGGVLVVTGTHFLDRMLDWFGYPVAATLMDDSTGGPEANAVASFTFAPNGSRVYGVARFSKSVALEGGIVIETDAGVVVLKDRPDAQIVFRPLSDPAVDEVLTPRASGRAGRGVSEFVLQIEDFVDAARSGRAPMVPGRVGLASMRLIEDLYRHRTPLVAASLVGGAR
jgi:predicted dehydrogenase